MDPIERLALESLAKSKVEQDAADGLTTNESLASALTFFSVVNFIAVWVGWGFGWGVLALLGSVILSAITLASLPLGIVLISGLLLYLHSLQ